MNDVDKRFDEMFTRRLYSTQSDIDPVEEWKYKELGITVGPEDVKAFIHSELRNQASEIIEALEVEYREAEDINFEKLRQKYLSDNRNF